MGLVWYHYSQIVKIESKKMKNSHEAGLDEDLTPRQQKKVAALAGALSLAMVVNGLAVVDIARGKTPFEHQPKADEPMEQPADLSSAQNRSGFTTKSGQKVTVHMPELNNHHR